MRPLPESYFDSLMPPAEAAAEAAAAAARECAVIARHPDILAGEPSRIVLLSDEGEKCTRMWLSESMAHLDFALLSATPGRSVLDAALRTGIRPDSDSRMTAKQTLLARANAKARYKALRGILGRLGYPTWITVLVNWRMGDITESEAVLFVPNFEPHVGAAKFGDQMARLADLFVQRAHIVRTDGVIRLVNTVTRETAILRNTRFGTEALQDLLRMMKDPNAWNRDDFEPQAMAAPELVDAAMFPRTVMQQRRVGVFGMMALSGSALVDQLIEWVR